MTTALVRRTLAAALLTGTLAGAGGCMTTKPPGLPEALRATEAGAFPNPVRQRVYLFMMNGDDLLGIGDLPGLRDDLCRAGFIKVYYAQKEDVAYFYREMRRLGRDEPDARMLLLGYGAAADRVVKLAEDAARDRLPLDAVILLDPAGSAACDLPGLLPVPSVAVKSHNWQDGAGLITGETVPVPIGHAGLPRHPVTLAVTVRLMILSASKVTPPSIAGLPHLPLRDKPEPTPRGVDPNTLGPAPPGWDFLRPAPRTVVGTPPATPTPPGTPLPTPREVAPAPRQAPPGAALPTPREVPR